MKTILLGLAIAASALPAWCQSAPQLVQPAREETYCYFSGDSRRLATGAGTIRVWDLPTLRLLKTYKPSHDVLSVALSQDGRRLALGSYPRHLQVWDIDRNKLIFELPIVPGATDNVGAYKVQFSPDGKQLLAVGACRGRSDYDQVVHVYDLTRGKEVRRWAWDIRTKRGSCVWGEHNQVVRLYDEADTLEFFSVDTGKSLRKVKLSNRAQALNRHQEHLELLLETGDATQEATYSLAGEPLASRTSRTEYDKKLPGVKESVQSIEGDLLFLSQIGYGGPANFYTLQGKKLGHLPFVGAPELSPDGHILAMAVDKGIWLMDVTKSLASGKLSPWKPTR